MQAAAIGKFGSPTVDFLVPQTGSDDVDADRRRDKCEVRRLEEFIDQVLRCCSIVAFENQLRTVTVGMTWSMHACSHAAVASESDEAIDLCHSDV